MFNSSFKRLCLLLLCSCLLLQQLSLVSNAWQTMNQFLTYFRPNDAPNQIAWFTKQLKADPYNAELYYKRYVYRVWINDPNAQDDSSSAYNLNSNPQLFNRYHNYAMKVLDIRRQEAENFEAETRTKSTMFQACTNAMINIQMMTMMAGLAGKTTTPEIEAAKRIFIQNGCANSR